MSPQQQCLELGSSSTQSFMYHLCRSLTEELLEKQKQLEDKLRLKLEKPAKERGFEAYVAQCAILEENKDGK